MSYDPLTPTEGFNYMKEQKNSRDSKSGVETIGNPRFAEARAFDSDSDDALPSEVNMSRRYYLGEDLFEYGEEYDEEESRFDDDFDRDFDLPEEDYRETFDDGSEDGENADEEADDNDVDQVLSIDDEFDSMESDENITVSEDEDY